MNIKCHWCQKDLEALEDDKTIQAIHQAIPAGLVKSVTYTDSDFFTMECPDIHCSLTMELREGYADRIASYYFFMDAADGKRYKVIGNRQNNQTRFLIKRQMPYKAPLFIDHPNWHHALDIKRYLAFKPNKETGILEGDAIFKRLKNLIIFS